MFPYKIFKQTLRAKYPHEFKNLKVLAVHRYTDESDGFFGSPEYQKYGDNIETLFEGSAR